MTRHCSTPQVVYSTETGATLLHPIKSNPMINNPFVNRLAVIILMFAVYAAGVSGGREQTVLTAQGKPVCQQVLKP